jgi:hypothetical protein
MVAGTWTNQDGLYLQFGTQKAVPEIGGDYLSYGPNRIFEQYIPLGTTLAFGTGGLTVPICPTSFSGTSTPIAAGIQSLTNLFPLQTTAPNTTSSGAFDFTATQLFIEWVEIETIVAAVGGTSLAVGLATINPANQQFVQVTPNAGVQLVNGLLTANMNAIGKKVTFYQPGTTTDSVPASVAGGGSWIGAVPLVTNSITPLPTNAYISSIATGTFTDGLLKLRVGYNIIGNISY